jgi:serine protease Do
VIVILGSCSFKGEEKMNHRFSRLFIPFLVVLLLLTACEFSASTANISNVTLARDEAGTQPTASFEPDETFYLVVDLANAPDDTTVRTAWYAVDVGTVAAPNTLIDEISLTSGSGKLFFNLAPSGIWAPGIYKADVYLNDELNQTVDIRVSGEVVQEAATPQATEEPEMSETLAVTNLQDVRQATIRIQAQGSFIDPEFGEMLNTAGQGSGFIIDESGIAVTNNHVVTGAAFLQVYIEGERNPRNARILGVSECSDLAVIDIDGDGFPYLEWREGPIDVGLDIYAAGYPFFGNEEYTLTRGIVSKARVIGETNWASVDRVLEVDATINPGNSGGPLVDADGRLVGVNYAGNDQTSQFFTISRDEAIPIIEQLRAEENVNSIGVNGQAVTDGQSIFGIWVASVDSGSPADRAGVKPGDIITKMEGLVLATDGTMADYCDILRSRRPDDVVSIEVLRFATEEVLEGQLNGRALEPSFSFARAVSEDVQQDPGSEGGSGPVVYSDFVGIYDDAGAVYVEVPAQWSDVDGSFWTSEGSVIGSSLLASPSLDGFNSNYTTPGVQILASAGLGGMNMNELVDFFDFTGDCGYDGRYDYNDPIFTGVYDLYVDCAGQGSVIIVLGAEPADRSFAAVVVVQAVTDADLDALDNVLNTFNVVDTLPSQ